MDNHDAHDIHALEQILSDQLAIQSQIEENHEYMKDATNTLKQIKSDMGDCQIPTHIKLRSTELNRFSEKFGRITGEFKDQVDIDENFDGDKTVEHQLDQIRA